MASAPPGPLSDVKTKAHGEGGQKQIKVYQTQMRMAQSQDDPASQRREEVGKLREDRSNAVIAKAISEAAEAVEKASAEAQSYIAEVREGSDGTLSSRMNSPIEQLEKSTEAILGERVIKEVKANMLQGTMQSASELESDDDDEERDEDEAEKPATRDKQKRSSGDKEDGRTDVSRSPS